MTRDSKVCCWNEHFTLLRSAAIRLPKIPLCTWLYLWLLSLSFLTAVLKSDYEDNRFNCVFYGKTSISLARELIVVTYMSEFTESQRWASFWLSLWLAASPLNMQPASRIWAETDGNKSVHFPRQSLFSVLVLGEASGRIYLCIWFLYAHPWLQISI